MAMILVLAVQDAGTASEWVRRLADDSVEAREKATEELLRIGRAAEKELRQALKAANEEVRGRAARILEEFDRRDRAREFEPEPRLVTLDRRDASLLEVLREIEEQSGTRTHRPDELAAERVTVAFERLPVLSAVEAVCKAHGGIDYHVNPGGDDVLVVVQKRRHGAVPRVLDGPYMVELRQVRVTKSLDFAEGASCATELFFHWGWPEGMKPCRTLVRLEELRDDAGTAYSLDKEAESKLGSGGFHAVIFTSQDVPDKATHFSIVKGALELTFPEAFEEASFDLKEAKAGDARTAGGARLSLDSVIRAPKSVTVRLAVVPAEIWGRFKTKAFDTRGIQLQGLTGTALGSAGGQGDTAVVGMTFKVPEGAEPGELRLAAPSGLRVRKIPFEFRDVKFR